MTKRKRKRDKIIDLFLLIMETLFQCFLLGVGFWAWIMAVVELEQWLY